MTAALRWMDRLRELQSESEGGVGTDKADKSPSVSSVGTPPCLFSEIEQAETAASLDPLAAAALATLVIDRALQRAAVGALVLAGYRVGIAIRVPAGGYASGILTVPTDDGFAILEALRRASN